MPGRPPRTPLPGVRFVVLLFALLAVWTTGARAQAPDIGAVEKAAGEVFGNDILARLKEGDRLLFRQRVATGVDGVADLRFVDDSRLHLGANTEVTLDEFVYRPGEGVVNGAFRVTRGVLRLGSGKARMQMGIQTPSATLGIRGTRFDVQVTPQGTELAVIEGEVEIRGPFGTQRVGAGRTFRVTAAGGDFAQAPSQEMQRAVVAMFTTLGRVGDYRTQLANYPAVVSLGRPATAAAPTIAPPAIAPPAIAPPAVAAPAIAPPSIAPPSIVPPSIVRPPDERAAVLAAIQGRDRDELLYVDLPTGRVVVLLRADLAPQHVARIKGLVRQGFYDGLAFHNVRPGFTAETGDPTGTGRGGTGQPLAPELSPEPFRAGSVGMITLPNRPFTADSQFFITLSDQMHLNGRYTMWGQVIHGQALLDALPAGSPPREPARIVRALIATDDR